MEKLNYFEIDMEKIILKTGEIFGQYKSFMNPLVVKRTPISACVSDAATATGSATTSVRMVRGEPGPRGGGWRRGALGLTAPALCREHAAEAHVGAGLDVRRPPLPHHQHLPVLASGAREAGGRP